MMVRDKLAAYIINYNVRDGCRVTFAMRERAVDTNGVILDGAVVQLVQVYSAKHENRMAQHLFHHNDGYAVGGIVSFTTRANNSTD